MKEYWISRELRASIYLIIAVWLIISISVLTMTLSAVLSSVGAAAAASPDDNTADNVILNNGENVKVSPATVTAERRRKIGN